MTRHRGLLVAAMVWVLGPACKPEGKGDRSLELKAGEVARVGGTSLSAELVAWQARVRQMTPRAALDELVDDARLSTAARAQGIDGEPPVRWACTATLSRSVAAQLQEAAQAQGPPMEDELASLTVVHAVVLRSTILHDEQGLAIADAIQDAVKNASADDFENRAMAVAHRGARVVVERIAHFGADGISQDGSPLDSKFVSAAFALHSRLETSPVVETSFGWHVIKLLARATPDVATLNRRRDELTHVVMALRARMQEAAMIRAWQHRDRVEVMGAAETLMAKAAARTE